MKNPNYRHGHRPDGKASPTYQSWTSMMSRCTNKNCRAFNYYGGRGISVCESWEDFRGFLSDMGERLPGTSLDRIDSNGNYGPGNCRWATKIQQARNTRHVKLTEQTADEIRRRYSNGESQRALAKEFGVARGTIQFAIHRKTWA